MSGRCTLLVTAVFILSGFSLANAEPFVNPPESNTSIPTGGWETPFPYQRNALIDFRTDPATWLADPVQGKDLVPGVNCDFEGEKDGDWYESDWFDWSGSGIVWHDQDPTGSGRQGLSGIEDQENTDAALTWHLDNCPIENTAKHIYLEVEYYANGYGEWFIAPSGPGCVFVNITEDVTDLGGGWVRRNIWILLEPNPPWEELAFNFYSNETIGGTVLIDHIHVATECVPEPAALSLLVLGGLALIRRRRSIK